MKLFFTLIIVALHLQLKVYCQSEYDSEHLNVYVNKPDETIKAKVIPSNNKKISTNKSKIYYWYSNNQILQTKGGFDGRLLDGEYSAFYLNSNLKEKGSFKRGLKDKEWRSWYENGKLKESVQWYEGIRNGYHELFNEKGEKILSVKYKNNKLNGKEIKYESGKIISEINYKNGVALTVKSSPESGPHKEKTSSQQINEENKKYTIPKKSKPVPKSHEKDKEKK